MFGATQMTDLHVAAIPHRGAACDNGLSRAPVEAQEKWWWQFNSPASLASAVLSRSTEWCLGGVPADVDVE